MSGVVTLDLNEVADEWQERISEMSGSVPDTEGMSWGEVADATSAFLAEPEQVEHVEQYAQLCRDLGGDPVEPDTLRWLSNRQGVTLIREDTFVEYAREFAEDIHGDIGELGSYIDWQRYADALRSDYYELTYDGHEWLRRA